MNWPAGQLEWTGIAGKSLPQCSVGNSARRVLAPQRAVFRRRRQQRTALAAIAAIELGLREQRARLGLAAGRKQRQPVERASEHAALNELRAALAKPAGQLHPRIVVSAHKAETMPGRAFGDFESDNRERTEFAWQRLAVLKVDECKRRRAFGDLKLGIEEMARFAALPVDFDLEKIGRASCRE